MDAVTLIRDARRAGLVVSKRGERLVVRGPRRLEPVAEHLLDHKPEVLQVLAEERETAWRIEVMRRQLVPDGTIPILIARPGMPVPAGFCWSCGDRVVPADSSRCQPCVTATTAVLASVG